MSFDIEKLAEKTENLSIYPVYDTNWCDMPDDIKLECIGKMKLKERLALRCSAKAERSLVDSQKIKFHEGDFSGIKGFGSRSSHVSVTSKNGDNFTKKFENQKQKFEFLNYILKIGEFDYYYISRNVYDPDVKEELMNYAGKISAKHIYLASCDYETVVAVLQKMNMGVKVIRIDLTWFDRIAYNFNDILAISQVQNVPIWHIFGYTKTDSLYKVAQMWIDKTSKIGFTFHVRMIIDGSFEEFSKHFADRIVSESANRARIRTNNPDRHILLDRESDYYFNCFRLLVIPTEMKESEYDDNYHEWRRKMYNW